MDALTSHEFTESDRLILKSQIPFMECLGTMFGDNCELVLHSFENLHESVIHIVNGHVTGRKIGAPVTNIALEKLSEFCNSNETWDVYFSNKNGEKRTFKSSSTLITNFDGVAIGMICINYSLEVSMYSFMKSFMHEPVKRKTENFSNDINSMVLSHLDPIKHQVYSDTNVPSKNKVQEIIKQLYKIGLFELPITTKIVSSELSVSTATVYKHLRQINRVKLDMHIPNRECCK
ncbi:transcriptional regulator [Photobacterium profundum]|nr:PAS domain-containing protein [Photobacterium profundum]